MDGATPETDAMRRARLRGLAVAMAGVGAGFWVGLAIGFRWHGDPMPDALSAGLAPAVGVLGVSLVLGARALWRGRRQARARAGRWRAPWRRRRPPTDPRDHVADRARWLAALRADPLRRAYAARIEAGDVFWTPLRIEYDLDRAATACCEHLAPIERAMREAGIRVRLQGGRSVLADCVPDPEAMAAAALPREPVQVQDVPARERSIDDPPEARLHCAACGSSVWVVHADRAGPATPRWPSPQGSPVTPVPSPG